MVVTASPERLRIPDLLKDWPWLQYLNPTFHGSLGDEELEYFFQLPEVRKKKLYQIMIQKAFVRTSTAFPSHASSTSSSGTVSLGLTSTAVMIFFP